MQMKFIKSLANYIEALQIKGQYTFTRKEALTALGGTDTAFRFAALRLIKKKHLIRPKQNFYVIVPTEYLEVGSPPVEWFIDALMKFYQQPYYVGLLSAAALYGAAHQSPQVFQVITNKPLRPIKMGRINVQFFVKKHLMSSSCQATKTFTGHIQVSFPEITAFDLIKHSRSVGHLSHVATVLSELQESFNEERFATAFQTENVEISVVQRLGYLLEIIEAKKEIILLLKHWLKNQKLRAIPLRSDKSYKGAELNRDWRLYINEEVEVDL